MVSPACYGCPFINIVTEYPEADYAGHQVAREHKESVRARLNQLAKESGAHQPEALSNARLLIMDGTYMAARQLIDAHCETASGR